MNTYDPKTSTGPAKGSDTTQPGKDGKAARDDVRQATDTDASRKSFSPLPKEEGRAPLTAAKGSDDLSEKHNR